MRDSFETPDWIDTLTLPVFVLMLSLGRMKGDAVIERFGALMAARVLISIAFIGLGIVVLAQNLFLAMLGFALIGLGICVVYPLTITAAAGIGDRPASENVAAFTLLNALVMMLAPWLIGTVAESAGIRIAFATLSPMFIVALWLAPKILRRG